MSVCVGVKGYWNWQIFSFVPLCFLCGKWMLLLIYCNYFYFSIKRCSDMNSFLSQTQTHQIDSTDNPPHLFHFQFQFNPIHSLLLIARHQSLDTCHSLIITDIFPIAYICHTKVLLLSLFLIETQFSPLVFRKRENDNNNNIERLYQFVFNKPIKWH